MKINIKKMFFLPFFAVIMLLVSSSFKDDFFEIAKQIEIFTELFKVINRNYVDDVNPAQLMDKSIKTMLDELDPYTNYYNEQDVLKAKINNTGEYTGIGAILTRKESKLIVKETYKYFPADKAGLKPGDEIVSIGDIQLIDFKDDVSQLLKGSKNTKIEIQYIRQNKKATANIILSEEDIRTVPYFAKTDDKTGYIVLTQFGQKSAHEVKDALVNLKKQGAEKIILDLRGNPGGLLNEAVNICNLFVNKNEVIVSTKSKIEKYNTIYKTTNEPVDTGIPLVVLIDDKSASASEIVSGALQDLDRAVIVGNRSFGKGLVQRPMELLYGTHVKVTISRYYTPSGRCIQALDYWHKDKDGKAIRTKSEQYNSFQTKNGRTVYDGGGINPDIVLNDKNNNTIIENLIKNNAIFDFATQYYYSNNTVPISLKDSDFQDFKNYLKTSKYNFETDTDKALKLVLEAAKKDKMDTDISLECQKLAEAVQTTENKLLDKYQYEIKQILLDEIIKRYQYKEGLYLFKTKNNPEILKSIAILNDLQVYNKLLKK